MTAFRDLALEVTRHHLCYLLLLTGQSQALCYPQIQGRGVRLHLDELPGQGMHYGYFWTIRSATHYFTQFLQQSSEIGTIVVSSFQMRKPRLRWLVMCSRAQSQCMLLLSPASPPLPVIGCLLVPPGVSHPCIPLCQLFVLSQLPSDTI